MSNCIAVPIRIMVKVFVIADVALQSGDAETLQHIACLPSME